MSIHDMNIANQGFPAFRSDLNNALSALVSNSSSATEPTTTFAYQFWADTTNDLLKQRNAANDGWISLLTLSTGAPVNVTNDAISEGNSSVEVVDSGTGYVTVVVDGSETARFTDSGVSVAGNIDGDYLEIITADAQTQAVFDGVTGGNARGLRVATANRGGTNNLDAILDAQGAVGAGGHLIFQTKSTTHGYIDDEGNFAFNSGYGSAGIVYGCRAWVNFNGTGTVAIRDSGNVSSITDSGTGTYTVNFTSAMPDSNYCLNVTSNRVSGSTSVSNVQYHSFGTTNVVVTNTDSTYSASDAYSMSVAVFR